MKALFITLLVLLPALAHSIEPFSTENSWYKPEIVESDDSEFCKELETDVTNHFSTNSLNSFLGWGYPVGTNKDKNGIFETLQFQDLTHVLPHLTSNTGVYRATVNGIDTIYSLKENHRSSGHAYFHLSGISFEEAKTKLNQDNIRSFIYGYEHKIYPEKRYGQPYIRLVKSKEKFYLIAENYDGNEITSFEFTTNSELKKVCTISTKPSSKLLDEKRKNLTKLSALRGSASQFLAGSGGKESCGTLNSHYYRGKNMAQTFSLSLYRPWAVSQNKQTLNNFNQLQESLLHWKSLGLWNHEIYSRYESHYSSAIKELSVFYQSEFGLKGKDASSASKALIQWALLQGLSGGINKNSNFKLANAIMDNTSLDKIKLLYIDDYAGENGYKESILSASIKRPEVINFLLHKGVSPNHQNVFGKTPLMYAVQYNQLDTVKHLLDSKADINTKTHIVDGWERCKYTIKRHNVTALHYAVRYSSYELIDLLIQSGAEIYAEDSDDLTPLDWLTSDFAVNNNLSLKEKESLNKKLAISILMLKEAKKLNIKGEADYRSKEYNAAFEKFFKVAQIDKANVRALNNLSITALKVGKHGEAAKYAERVLRLSANDSELASAYYNYAKACEENRRERKIDGYLSYDGDYYCTYPVIYYYVKAFEHKPSKARAETIEKQMQMSEGFKWRHSCTKNMPTGLISAYHVKYDLYLLADNSYQPTDYSFRKLGKDGYKKFIKQPLTIDREIKLNDQNKLIVLTSNGEFTSFSFFTEGLTCKRGLDSFFRDEPGQI